MYVAVNRANTLEVHSFHWTEDSKLIICGQEADPKEWDIVEILFLTNEEPITY